MKATRFRCAAALAVCLPLLIAGCGQPTEVKLVNDSILDPNAINFATGTWGTCINGQTFQIDALVTFGSWQYATWFDAEKRICVGRRKLPGGDWQRIAFGDYKLPDHKDVHNVPVIGICPADGTIHLSFDHHVTPLRYRVSRPGVATSPDKVEWTAAIFSPVMNSLGEGKNIPPVTYPAFAATPDGRLLFYHRDGGSGDGDGHLAIYDPAKGGWSLMGMFTNRKGDFRGSQSRYGYINGMDFDSSGRLHVTWTWREGQDIGKWGLLNCHDLMYAYSDDAGRSWRNNDGQEIGAAGAKPITIDSPGTVVATIPYRWGSMNQVTQTIDSRGRIHVIMWHNPPDAAAAAKDLTLWRYFHYWRDENGKWQSQQLPFYGRKPSILANTDGSLLVFFTKPGNMNYHGHDAGGPLHIYRASSNGNWSDWRQIHVSELSFVGEPRFDRYRWQQDRILSIYAQQAPVAAGKPSELHVMDFQR